MARLKIPPMAPASADEMESQFYDALQHADIERLMAVWADDDDIVCVHPGGSRLFGREAIRGSFERMFERGPVNAHPEQVRRMQSPSCAVHSVLERVDVQAPGGPQHAWVVATNIYIETALGWRLASHHASPGAPGVDTDFVETSSVLH
ncbi:MAG: nuclear transport factor 2 family protein [Caldimonas sp.]